MAQQAHRRGRRYRRRADGEVLRRPCVDHARRVDRRDSQGDDLRCTLVPMLCGSSFHNKGVQKLLDCIIAFLPSPLDRACRHGYQPQDRARRLSATLRRTIRSAVWRSRSLPTPSLAVCAFVRVYSGKLDAGSYVLDTRSGKRERISRIYQMHSNKQNPIETVSLRATSAPPSVSRRSARAIRSAPRMRRSCSNR